MTIFIIASGYPRLDITRRMFYSSDNYPLPFPLAGGFIEKIFRLPKERELDAGEARGDIFIRERRAYLALRFREEFSNYCRDILSMKRGQLSRCSSNWRSVKRRWEFYSGERRQIVRPIDKWKNAASHIVGEGDE